MQQQQKRFQTSSSDDSLSRVFIHSAEQTSEHTLPLSITPSTPTTVRRTSETQTAEKNSTPKSVPSFAETQLLSVYYPSLDPKNPSTNDKCIFVEQQDRQPIRYRAAYDPLSSSRSTQTSPSLSTYGSTLIIDRNQSTDVKYDQHVKIHSGSQNLPDTIHDRNALPSELLEESKYSYEEYIVHVERERNRTPSSSSSSVTTVIAQNGEVDSDRTSNLSFEVRNNPTLVTSTPIKQENQRVSSWPPVPDDIMSLDVQYENDEAKRSGRVQFAEQLIHVIPPSTTTSLSDESTTPPAIIPRTNIKEQTKSVNTDPQPVEDQLQRQDYRPINQSKWVKTQLDRSETQTNTTSHRVDTLRSMFEQQSSRSSDSSTISSPTSQSRRKEPDERPSRQGDEIRFRVKDKNSFGIHHAEPAKIIQYTITPSAINKQVDLLPLQQIRQITGKQLKSLDDAGHYLQDGYTWQWNEIFWLSLTTSQRDQLKELERQLTIRPRSAEQTLASNDSELSSVSSNETKRYKSTINITAAGSWQLQKSTTAPSGITKYTETSTIHESQPTVSVFGSAPNSTASKVGSQESITSSGTQQQVLTSSKRTDSQLTIIESGYGSADDQQRFRPNSSTIIEESPTHQIGNNIRTNPPPKQPKLDPLSYEQFVNDYLSTYARPTRSTDGTLLLSIDDQQIHLPHIRFSSSNSTIIHSDAIDKALLPFETESNELVIFVYGTIINIPADRWLIYRNKYSHTRWVQQLKRVNRNLPQKVIPSIDRWLLVHATLSIDTHELNVDGLTIPYLDRLDSHQLRQFQTNPSNEMFSYLMRTGFISYDEDQTLIHIGNSELDAHLLFTPSSAEFVERVTNALRSLTDIQFNNENGSLILTDDFIIPHEYLSSLLSQIEHGGTLNAHELAQFLCEICQIEEDENYQSLTLTFGKQTLRLKASNDNHVQILSQWLEQLNYQGQIHINEENDVTIYPSRPHQQIFIKHEYVEEYMASKAGLTNISMNDLANILLFYNFVQYSSGQLIFPDQQIVVDTNQLTWLQSIIQSIRLLDDTQETEVELFDGQHTQNLRIPYEYMFPTDQPQLVASYLLQNGNIRFEVNTGNYEYVYARPEEKALSVDRENIDHTRENLIDDFVEYVNNQNGVQYDNTKNLLVLENPSNGSKLYLTLEHTQFIQEKQYRRQDMKYILKKHAQLKRNESNQWILYYNNQSIPISIDENVSSNLSQETPNDLLRRYHATIEHMYNRGLITCNKRLKLVRMQCTNETLTIPTDFLRSILNMKIFHSPNADILPFTSQELSQWLLDHSSNISRSSEDFIQITYRNRLYHLPLISSNTEDEDRKLELLFPFNTSLRLLQKTPSTTTLDIQQPDETNDYAIDPLLILANYVHRAGTIYQDQLGRLVIKLDTNEIVIPRADAASSIESINTSPQRAGTIIARLIHRIGKVQSNQSGGLIITIGKKSIDISKESINRTSNNDSSLHAQNSKSARKSSNLPVLQQSKSANNLSSFADDQQILSTKDNRTDIQHLTTIQRDRTMNNPIQTSRQLKPRIIIIPDNDLNATLNRATRFYVQHTSESNSTVNINSNSIQQTQPQLITPQSFRDATLRDAPVFVRQQGREIHYENLAHYLATEQVELASHTVRHMLKFSSDDEYFAYLNKKMSSSYANKLVRESEEKPRRSSSSSHLIDRQTRASNENLIRDRSKSPNNSYNVQNGTTRRERSRYPERDQRYAFDRSLSSSSRSPLTTSTGGHSLTTPDKNVTLPRTLSGQSNDGESESRATVSRSASAAAKVTSKSDTIKSTTSSSAASSREASPNRTSGSKTADDSTKKEKKSKFRTPSFLRKRKEKKEAAGKDKAEK
ncbi:unnamed protein product [Adineta ricciae]|uniref:Uncharacterized protein n=1 Tax=Adineta ricciae TaxID=249248 RepID=A0A814JQU9_ADIRI|nr:unnamed protein product [Adineta ricciae]